MNYAVIIAGGIGARMHQDIPKQFINIYDKPIIIYTLEAFEKNPMIDGIVVVCIEAWIPVLKAYAKQFNITKIINVVPGGTSGQESIRNGVFALDGICSDNDIVVIHDGIRPMVEQNVLDDCILVCQQKGNAVSAMPYNEQIFIKNDDGKSTDRYIKRETIMRVSTPQAYCFKKLKSSYEKAFANKIGIYGSAYTNTMMSDLGETLYFSAGSERNIKLTTPEDIYIFKALLKIKSSTLKD